MSNQANEEYDDEPMKLSLDIEDEEEEAEDDEDIRNQAGLNSPKIDDNEVTSLSLADESENTGADSPGTQMRNKYGINSPRGKKSAGFSGGGVESLVTQVARTDESGPGGQDQDDDTHNNMMQETTGGICACFSCLWTCCSSEEKSATTSKATEMEVKKPDDDTHLLNNNETKTVVGKQEEESVSESDNTIYDDALLPALKPEHKGRKCLVLDLDETLVHSSFKPIPKPDFIIPVEIDHVVHHVYVLKRPYVDEFLLRASKHYEIVIFTASLSKYADPLLDKLDINNTIEHRLFRESCVIHGTAYVKDLRKLGRRLKDSIIVDNSPPSYLFQPTNAVPIASWFDDPKDTQLLDFLPVLETTMKDISDVRKLLDANSKSYRWLCNQKNKPVELFD